MAPSFADSSEAIPSSAEGMKENLWIDKIDSGMSFVLNSREINWENNQGWNWITMQDYNGAHLEMVEAVQIYGREEKKIKELTPSTSYEVSFILMKKEDDKGVDQSVKLKLLTNEVTVECTKNLSSMPLNKWTEIRVGNFITPRVEMLECVEISMALTDKKYKGLVVNKIILWPIKKNWKELSGENKWRELLDPFNVDLSNFIIDCGERIDAIYDGMNKDANSPSYGLPMYEEKEFFSKVGPEKDKAREIYKVKKYIYSSVNVSSAVELLAPNRSAWIGYVAVATDEGKELLGRRDILVCWRGTLNLAEWEKNATFSQTHAEVIYPSVPAAKVHKGFYSIYTEVKANSEHEESARDQVIEEVTKLVNFYQGEEVSITITGYSLGAGLATLNAADIVSNEYNKPDLNKEFLVTTFVFGSPKVGDIAFQTEFNKHILERKLRLLRIENDMDVITKIPPGNYVKVGNEITFTRSSASLNEHGSKKTDHNLKNYIREICALPYSSPKVSSKSISLWKKVKKFFVTTRRRNTQQPSFDSITNRESECNDEEILGMV